MSYIQDTVINSLISTSGIDTADYRTVRALDGLRQDNTFSGAISSYQDVSKEGKSERQAEVSTTGASSYPDAAVSGALVAEGATPYLVGSVLNTRPLVAASANSTAYQDFSAKLTKVAVPDAQGKIHEEQMQFTLVYYFLSKRDEKLAQKYLAIYDDIISSFAANVSPEDAVKAALKVMVSNGQLSTEEAEKINGLSFRAAQLDDNLTALYDNRGSESDETIAAYPLQEALVKAFENIEAIDQGTITAAPRSLDAPSNVAPQLNSAADKTGTAESAHDGAGGFLWKPVSESDGKLAVLLPSSLTGQIISLEIFATAPAAGVTAIDQGRFVGNTNGNRATFRFNKSGGEYPDGCYVVAQLKNGETRSFHIADSSQRVE